MRNMALIFVKYNAESRQFYPFRTILRRYPKNKIFFRLNKNCNLLQFILSIKTVHYDGAIIMEHTSSKTSRNEQIAEIAEKGEWEKPVLTKIKTGLSSVKNGFFTGTDGAGGFNTSQS